MREIFIDAQSRKTARDIQALQSAVDIFNADTRAHEQHHVNDALATYVPFDTIGQGVSCDEREADNKAVKAAFKRKDEQISAMEKEYRAKSAAFDKSQLPVTKKEIQAIWDAWSLLTPTTKK
jgi:predicted secreted Zn-dependent protease